MFGSDIAMLEKGVVLNLAETFLKIVVIGSNKRYLWGLNLLWKQSKLNFLTRIRTLHVVTNAKCLYISFCTD
jgi:hypothetical protein